jgi:subtilisin-like proprotein convertase family protein
MSSGDGSSLNGNSFHATHVSGTISASGVNPNAKGMAPLAKVKTFDWFNDQSEVLNQVQSGMLVSNHSYGIPIENASTWFIGAYSSASRDWDIISYNAPYYLMVASAGNNGSDSNPSPSTAGFDKLTGNKLCKNNLVVANTQAAIINSSGELVSVSINSSSSQGPADDRRIKPDISGQGSGLISSGDASDSAYLTLSGTSMSAPNVSGSLILLQEYYNQRNNKYMKAATLKGLVCHTADDAGNPGPDARFGWGLLNSKKAAETILFNGLSGLVAESELRQGQSKTYTFVASGVVPFSATICWTDPAGQANNGINNSTVPALVNDLDIRITKNNEVFFPWRLQSNAALNATRNSDNNIDNVESVKIDTPENATYTVTITHKNSLFSSKQDFSLIVTGLESSFAINPLNEQIEVCNNQNAVYSFDFKNLDFSSVEVSASSLPSGAIATFNQTSLFVDDIFTMTVSNLANVPAGEYNIIVQGTRGTEIKQVTVKLVVYSSTFTNAVYLFPSNNFLNVAQNSVFSWQTTSNATEYVIQVATDSNFSNIIFQDETSQTFADVSNLNLDQTYFWRVLSKNLCGTASNSTVFSFRTGLESCNNNYTATNFSNATISDDLGLAIIPITVNENFTVSDVTVNLNLTHPKVQELKVYLEAPASLNLPDILLINQSCGAFENINASINDSAPMLTCSSVSPAITGTFKPFQNMFSLNNLNSQGVWRLKVVDDIVENGGIVNSFSINFCNTTQNLSTSNFTKNDFKLYPNPSENIITLEVEGSLINSPFSISDIQGRIINNTVINEITNQIDVSQLQSGVYFLKIKSNNQEITKRFIKK